MEQIGNREKWTGIIASIIYVALIVMTGFLLWSRGIESIPAMYVINVSIDIFAMLTGFVLSICCLIDVQKSGTNIKYIMYLINITFLGILTDAGAWLVDGIADLRWLNILDNTLYYIYAPISACFFWMYVTSIIRLSTPLERKIDKFIQYGMTVPVALRIINLFTGIYFTVGTDGVYSRAPLYPLSKLYYALVLAAIAFVVIKERKQLAAYQIVAAILYILAPLAVAIFTVFVYGLSISAAATMLVLLLMYCVHNVSQGREKAAADRDLMVAAAIQENILPRTFPYLPERREFDIYATMTPAKEVGGDFYDFFMTDDDHLAFLIADVSGKGMPAALFMMVARTLIKNQALSASDKNTPCDILYAVNNQLCEGNSMEYFVTAWLGILELSSGKLVYASAGHEYPAASLSGGDFVIYKKKNAPPLGTMENLKFRGGEITLSAGDTVYIYTDGVTDAMNAKKELFGLDRMLDTLNANVNADLKTIDDSIRGSIQDFVKDAPQFDDITMLSIRYNGNNGAKKNQI